MYGNKRKIYELVYYLLDNSYAWHLQYMQAVLIPSEINKIIKEREKFNKSILERIVNLLEPEGTIDKITIFVCGLEVIIDRYYYADSQLLEMKELLEHNKTINVKGECKSIYIEKYDGYEITYLSEYEDRMTNKGNVDN